MKLAAAASLRLKGVVVEYDVLCSSRIGQGSAAALAHAQAVAQARAEAQAAADKTAPPSASGMFVSDVRAMLKDLRQDSTGKPWVVKDRLQSALQGLPSQMLDQITGSRHDVPVASGRTEEEIYLEKQLASASEELERVKLQRAAAVKDQQSRSASATSGPSVRDKYLDKLNKLKSKAKTRSPSEIAAATAVGTGAVGGAEASAVPAEHDGNSKGLSSWLVNPGANELISYVNLRGMFLAVIPPGSTEQEQEYEGFLKEVRPLTVTMKDQFDASLEAAEKARMPDPAPIISLCDRLNLSPVDVLVIARHAPTIQSAKAAGTHVCHYMPGDKAIPNHTAHHHFTTLLDFQQLVEEFNGISYRNLTHVQSMF